MSEQQIIHVRIPMEQYRKLEYLKATQGAARAAIVSEALQKHLQKVDMADVEKYEKFIKEIKG